MSRYRSTRLAAKSGHDAAIVEAVNDFLLYHRRKGHSENCDRELRSYLIGSESRFGRRRVWSPFVRWAREHRLSRVRDLTKDTIGAYLDHVQEHTSKSDYGKVCAIFKRLFGFFVAEQLLENEPLRIERPKRLKAEIKVFTPNEIERMRHVVAKENVRDQAIFMLLLDTGIRASELCNRRLDDVRWSGNNSLSDQRSRRTLRTASYRFTAP
jgi:site-specific recombinase XerD